MDSTPADFAFHGEALSVVRSDFCSALDGFGSEGSVASRVFSPVLDSAGGVDSDRSVFANPVCSEDVCYATGFFNGKDKVVPVRWRAESGAPNSSFPDGGYKGANLEVFGGNEVGDLS